MSQKLITAQTYITGWCAKALLPLKVVITRLRCLSGGLSSAAFKSHTTFLPAKIRPSTPLAFVHFAFRLLLSPAKIRPSTPDLAYPPDSNDKIPIIGLKKWRQSALRIPSFLGFDWHFIIFAPLCKFVVKQMLFPSVFYKRVFKHTNY